MEATIKCPRCGEMYPEDFECVCESKERDKAEAKFEKELAKKEK